MAPSRLSALALLAALVPLPAATVGVEAAPARAEREKAPHPPVTLDDLFARLKASEDADEAKGIATLVQRRLARSGSATVDLITDRARIAISADDVPLAIELMDRAMNLEPNWAEGWNRRATLFWRLSDEASAIADLQRTLVLEPRHFEAWAALGKLHLEADDKRKALDAFRRAEQLYPAWDAVKKAIERLVPDVEGRDL